MNDEMQIPTSLEEVTGGLLYQDLLKRLDGLYDGFGAGEIPQQEVVFEGLPWLRYKNRFWESSSDPNVAERRFVEHVTVQVIEANPDILIAQHGFLHDMINFAAMSEGTSILWKISISAVNATEPGDSKNKFNVRVVLNWMTVIDG